MPAADTDRLTGVTGLALSCDEPLLAARCPPGVLVTSSMAVLCDGDLNSGSRTDGEGERSADADAGQDGRGAQTMAMPNWFG